MNSLVERYEGWMLAKSPIAHFGNEKTGSTPVLRTIYMHVEGQGEVPIPYINGNAVRNKIRRLFMRDFFFLIGLDPEELHKKLYHFFFSGGSLENIEYDEEEKDSKKKNLQGVIDLGLKKRIRTLLPCVSLMGGAFTNQIMQGKLKVGHCFPICSEYRNFLPESLKQDARGTMSVRAFTDESFHTRRDDLRAGRTEDEQAVQMKIDYECFIPGTKFYHWFALEVPTDMDKSAFGRYTEIFKASPFLGGMSGTGDGEVIFEYQPEFPSSVAYSEFIQSHKEEIINLLIELQKLL